MIRILIVEDEKPISNLLRLSLTKEGYACTCAFDGAEAADLLERGRYDLVLLDGMLPEIDGFELMEYIRPMEMPVIFITAKNAVNDRVRGSGPGLRTISSSPLKLWSCWPGWTWCCAAGGRTRRCSGWAAWRLTPAPCRCAGTARRLP